LNVVPDSAYRETSVFSPYGPNNSLDIRILPRRARGRKHFVDAKTFYSIAESFTIDAIAITQQIAWSGIERVRLH